jgi:hypothetical protein
MPETSHNRLLFPLLFLALLASRMCHAGILWESDSLGLATAGQMLLGKTIYQGIWFDKPPLVPLFHLLSGARPGWALRLEDALYALLCCWVVYAFARDLWSRREGVWAACLLAFYLIFYIPSAVIPVASDLLMLAPHAAAVWMAHRRRAFWSGALAALAFWISPKAVFVSAACLLWYPAGAAAMAAGWMLVSAIAAAALWGCGALGPYWREVWVWGRVYAGSAPFAHPFRNGVLRTLNWAGFHSAACAAAVWFLIRSARAAGWGGPFRTPAPADETACLTQPGLWRWAGWLAISLAGAAAGLRFFPRYYFLVLPVVVLMAARGFTLLGRKAVFPALLMLIPFVRFGPTYVRAVNDPGWADIAMDSDSRAASALIRGRSRPGDTLFVWGYRPEMYAYTRLPTANIFLDSQPLTGVPADRHLGDSRPVETAQSARNRAALTAARPTFIAEGLGAYNPRLAITAYPDLRVWLQRYREVARTPETVIYRLAE